MIVTSRQNPKVKAVAQLRKRKGRDEQGVLLVEGYEELSLAMASGAVLQQVFYCPELMRADAQLALLQKVDGTAEVIETNRSVFEKLAYRDGADGWLAIAAAVSTALADIPVPTDRAGLYIICEAIEKPGNLGAILRTADAAGADGVILANAVTDWFNPNVIRASKGALFAVPVATASNDQVQRWLESHAIVAYAATPETKTLYTDADMTQSCAILVGTEKHGLSGEWLSVSTYKKVQIPMQGRVDSLNVATSAAIIVYEAVRQRMIAIL